MPRNGYNYDNDEVDTSHRFYVIEKNSENGDEKFEIEPELAQFIKNHRIQIMETNGKKRYVRDGDIYYTAPTSRR